MLTNLSASRMHSCHNEKNSCLLHVQALVACRSTACLSIVSKFRTQGPFSSLVSQVWLLAGDTGSSQYHQAAAPVCVQGQGHPHG